eukprot:6106980-Prorocentrum_lima.AAC.1
MAQWWRLCANGAGEDGELRSSGSLSPVSSRWCRWFSAPANFAVQAKFRTPLVVHAVSSSVGCGA